MVRWIITGAVILLALVVGFIAVIVFFPAAAPVVRDVAVVILAVLQMVSSFLIITFFIVLLYVAKTIDQVTRTTVVPKIDDAVVKVNEVLDNTRTVTGNARDSASTVTTTTVFVAERVVSPIIRISSLMAGVRAAASTIARRDAESEQG